MLQPSVLHPPSKPAVLVVDGDTGMRQMLQTALEGHGFEVWTAASGQEALDVYQRHGENLGAVLLDAGLPDMAGTALGSELHSLNPHTPICFMCGSLGEQEEEKLRQQGARYLFAKPFNPDGMAYLLQEMISCAAKELEASGVY